MTTIDGQLDRAKEEAKREELQLLERELEAAGQKLGTTTVEYERARFMRDRAKYAYNGAIGRLERFLNGESV